jgi:uncharacterized protein YegL
MSSSEELYTILPFFLLVDVSASMAGGAVEAINAALPQFKHEMLTNPTVGEIARIAVITFSDEARVALPLCDLAYSEIPEIMVEGGTNFAAGFRATRAAIEDAVKQLPKGTPLYRPVVFFISDGQHMAREDWKPALKSLCDASWKFAPQIVAFGFGDVDDESMRQIATRHAFRAKVTDPVVAVREIMSSLMNSIRTTSTSFRDPNQAQGLHIEPSPGFFTPMEALEI